jgi:hypothetical protein
VTRPKDLLDHPPDRLDILPIVGEFAWLQGGEVGDVAAAKHHRDVTVRDRVPLQDGVMSGNSIDATMAKPAKMTGRGSAR